MLPRFDLPKVLLEVDGWTGYLSQFTHIAETGIRVQGLSVSMAAVLVAEAATWA